MHCCFVKYVFMVVSDGGDDEKAGDRKKVRVRRNKGMKRSKGQSLLKRAKPASPAALFCSCCTF